MSSSQEEPAGSPTSGTDGMGIEETGTEAIDTEAIGTEAANAEESSAQDAGAEDADELVADDNASPENDTELVGADQSDTDDNDAELESLLIASELPARRRLSRASRRTVTLITAALLLTGTGYTIAAAQAEVPAPVITLNADASATIVADTTAAQAAVAAQPYPTAIGFAEDDDIWVSDDTAYPIASLTKLITALICMEVKPLDPGAAGESYTWTAEDAARSDAYRAVDGVAFSIPVGTELTQRDMLQLMLIPSANDVAYAYAQWVFGTNEAFIEAFTAWRDRHGLTSLSISEPTGFEISNVGSASDLVRLARLALANPAITEITAVPAIDMPWGIGMITNTNPLLGVLPGVIGLKTGSLNDFGRNLVAAQQIDALGRPVTSISVTLGRQTEAERAAAGTETLAALAALPQQMSLVEAGTPVGTATLYDGSTVELTTANAVSTVLLPGEQTTAEVAFDGLTPGKAGREVGSLRVTTPTGVQEVPVTVDGAIGEPDLWWRILHPSVMFG